MKVDQPFPLKILYATSEMYPLMQSTSLANIAASLPVAISELNNDVRIILPAYPNAIDKSVPVVQVACLRISGYAEIVRIMQATLDTGLTLYLVDMPGLFDRSGDPYVDIHSKHWQDNADRFFGFAKAIVALSVDRLGLGWMPDIVHCNDWPTGLVPVLLSKEWNRPSTVFSINYLKKDETYDYKTFSRLDLDARWWSYHGLEYNEHFSFLKGGLVFSDQLITTSEEFAKELIQTGHNEFSDIFAQRKDRLSGILTAVNKQQWDPMKDTSLLQSYNLNSIEFKLRNKLVLQEQVGLKEDKDALLFGFYGCLNDQQNSSLVLSILPYLMKLEQVQLLFVGDKKLIDSVSLAHGERYHQRIAIIQHNKRLPETRMIAGCDVMILPNEVNADGLMAMHCFAYGTIPLARATGGMKQLIVNSSPRTQLDGSANGFVFEQLESDQLWVAIQRAHEQFRRPGVWWKKLIETGMSQEFNWHEVAKRYRQVYQSAMDHPASNPLG